MTINKQLVEQATVLVNPISISGIVGIEKRLMNLLSIIFSATQNAEVVFWKENIEIDLQRHPNTFTLFGQ